MAVTSAVAFETENDRSFFIKVLEVHEQILEKSLDSDETSDDLCDGEKALVREMCNVRSLARPAASYSFFLAGCLEEIGR